MASLLALFGACFMAQRLRAPRSAASIVNNKYLVADSEVRVVAE